MKIKALLLLLLLLSPAVFASNEVIDMNLDGTIHPITAEYITKGIDRAEAEHAAAVIIRIQTPGGLETSMRTIISRMIQSTVPMIVYVAPSGSRATSAGFYIMIAADVAAMSPGTHLGSAHPVFAQDTPDSENTKTLLKKAEEDSVAYIKTLAQRRGRNVEQSEKAVRESISFTETEALKANLINYIAADENDLLQKLNGTEIKRFNGSTQKLILNHPTIVTIPMTRRERFLSFLADPNIAFYLVGLGMLGLMVELYNPGAIFPGIVGVICLSLFLLSVQLLPINYAGLVLIGFAIVLFALELKIHSYGLLTVGGLTSLALGATMLIDAPIPEMKIAFRVVATVIAVVAITMIFLVSMVISLHRKKPTTGVQGIMQEIGTAQTDIDPDGQVFIHGGIWQAVSQNKIAKGEKVRIVSIDGLTLHVQKCDETRSL
jgi:membrane-bound serine protease (ClpP class)